MGIFRRNEFLQIIIRFNPYYLRIKRVSTKLPIKNDSHYLTNQLQSIYYVFL